MIRITGCTVSHNFCENLRTSLSRMLQFFQNNHAGTFSHDKSASVFVKWQRTLLRIIYRRKCCQCGKTCHTNRADTCFRTACQHHIRISTLDTAICLSDGMGSRCTRGYHIQTFSFQPQLNRNIPCCHVGDHQWNQKWVYSGGSFLRNFMTCCFCCLQTSDSRSDGTSHAKRIFFFHIQSRLFKRLFCCSHRILAEQFHSLRRLKVHIVFSDKILYFRSNVYFIICRIKPGNLTKSQCLFLHILPECLHTNPNRCHSTHSGHNYSSHNRSSVLLFLPVSFVRHIFSATL